MRRKLGLFTFTKEILNAKLPFLCNDRYLHHLKKSSFLQSEAIYD